MTYQVIITEEVANVAVTSESYPIIIEYNATNMSDTNTYGNANVADYLASGTNSSIIDNIGNIITNGSIAASGIMVAGGNVIGGNIRTAGQVSATGNITGNYFIGNGSQLTGVVATSTYGNANVAAYLPTYTGNVGAGNVNVSGIVYTPQVESSGDLDLNTTGRVNINGNIRVGDNNSNTQIATMGTGDLILTTHQGDAAQGNIRIYDGANGNIALTPNGTGQVTTTAVSASGNVTAAYVIGNGSALTSLTGANVTGTVANATYALTSNAATYSTIATFATTANAVAGANVSGTVANATYATSAGSATTATLATFATTANAVAGANVSGTVANATYATSAGSATTASTATSATTAATVTDAAQGNITSVGTLTSLSVSGNITGGNVVSLGTVTAAGNLTSTQQTVIGTANVGTTGNIVVSGKNIATDMAYSPDGATGTALYTGRVLVGTGWNGNNAVGLASRLSAMDMINRGNTASQVRQIDSDLIVNLTGNVTNTSFRQQAIGGRIRVGGGSAGNTTNFSGFFASPFTIAAAQNNLEVGNISPYFLGNTSLAYATLNSGTITINAGSSVGTAFGYVPAIASGGSGASSNITNYIGMASTFAGANVTGNLFCFYNGNSTSLTTYGVQSANSVRAATNYYFLRNDDDVAQNKLGSLRSYHEYQHALATSGTVNIDKSNSQVQYLAPTANVTIGDLQNFVTNASDSVNNDPQSDSVTLIIKQGATPYTVTMPTGNASIKYASNVSTVGTSANSVTMINITGANVGGAALYLVTVSPEFV